MQHHGAHVIRGMYSQLSRRLKFVMKPVSSEAVWTGVLLSGWLAGDKRFSGNRSQTRIGNPTFSGRSVFPAERFFTWIESRLVLFDPFFFTRSFPQLFAAPILRVSPVSDTPRTSRAPTTNRTPCLPPPPPSPRAPSSRASASAPPRPSGASRPTGRARKLTREKEPRKVSHAPTPIGLPTRPSRASFAESPRSTLSCRRTRSARGFGAS